MLNRPTYEELKSHWLFTSKRILKLQPLINLKGRDTDENQFWMKFDSFSRSQQTEMIEWIKSDLELDDYFKLIVDADPSQPAVRHAILQLLENNKKLRQELYDEWSGLVRTPEANYPVKNLMVDAVKNLEAIFAAHSTAKFDYPFAKDTIKQFRFLIFGSKSFATADLDDEEFKIQLNNILGVNAKFLLESGWLVDAAIDEASEAVASMTSTWGRAIGNIRQAFFGGQANPMMVEILRKYPQVCRELHSAYHYKTQFPSHIVPENIANNFSKLLMLSDDPVSFAKLHAKHVKKLGLAQAAALVAKRYPQNIFQRFLAVSVGFFTDIKDKVVKYFRRADDVAVISEAIQNPVLRNLTNLTNEQLQSVIEANQPDQKVLRTIANDPVLWGRVQQHYQQLQQTDVLRAKSPFFVEALDPGVGLKKIFLANTAAYKYLYGSSPYPLTMILILEHRSSRNCPFLLAIMFL